MNTAVLYQRAAPRACGCLGVRSRLEIATVSKMYRWQVNPILTQPSNLMDFHR